VLNHQPEQTINHRAQAFIPSSKRMQQEKEQRMKLEKDMEK